MRIKITHWNKRYINAIDRVFLETWLETYPNTEYNITKDDVYSAFWTKKQRLEKREKRLNEKEDSDTFLMAKIGNSITWVAKWKVYPDFNELEAIYILPRFQRKWIGKILWNTMQSYFLKDIPTIVRVASYNSKALEFYKQLGFLEHTWKYDTKKVHSLKNWKELPLITLILE